MDTRKKSELQMGFQPMTLRDLRGTQRIVSVKLSVRKALNPLRFTKGNFHLEFSWYGKFKV